MTERIFISALFFVSGFCGLLYQVVWLRLSMTEFGVISPVISAVLSVFMLGLGLGSWLGGRIAELCRKRWAFSPILFYAFSEFVIGLGGLLVPGFLKHFSRNIPSDINLNSHEFLFRSFLAILLSLLPFTLAMGTTFPLMIGFLRERWKNPEKGFSFLYLANVAGAAAGTLSTAFLLIELNGFHGTLEMGAKLNLFAFLLSVLCWQQAKKSPASPEIPEDKGQASGGKATPGLLPFLFLSGFISMGLEVVWNRVFSGRLENSVYGFAIILTTYLLATAAGTLTYRTAARRFSSLDLSCFYPFLFPLALAGILSVDPFPAWLPASLLFTIVPVSFLFGALTPAAMDAYSQSDEKRAGDAYAVNIAGCILGPLAAAYVLLPLGDEVPAILALSLLLLPGLFFLARAFPWQTFSSLALSGLILFAIPFIPSFSPTYYGPLATTLHDHTASVSVYGAGMRQNILVNHVPMTTLTTITKMMVHFPMALKEKKPESALVICFGMGTTFRSALSWGVPTTVVELVPSVPKVFSRFHSDAASVMESRLGRIVIDDGRRFLRRTAEKFDFITLDPPPPIDAAASGMLYSREFYEQVKERLQPNGILQQWWYTTQDLWLFEAELRTVAAVFPHVMIFPSVEGWGFHIIASAQPINVPGIKTLEARIPQAAQRDMVEWESGRNVEALLAIMANRGKELWEIPGFVKAGPEITDDMPLNEYFFIRSHFLKPAN
jgi:spermidine synthase